MRIPSKYSTAQHKMYSEKALDHLEKHGRMTAHDLADAIGVPVLVVRGYLYRFLRTGEAHSQRTHGVRGQMTFALYGAGPAEGVTDVEIPSRRTVKEFPAHAVRDPLVAALFGQAVHS